MYVAVPKASVFLLFFICIAVVENVGYKNILSTSQMNSMTVILLKTVDLVNSLVVSGVVIISSYFRVLPLSAPSKKLSCLTCNLSLKIKNWSKCCHTRVNCSLWLKWLKSVGTLRSWKMCLLGALSIWCWKMINKI